MTLLNGISWVAVAEMLFLFSVYMLWIAGRLVAKYSPNDALLQFTQVFWRSLSQRPAPLREVVPDDEIDDLMPQGSDDAMLQNLADSRAEEEAEESQALHRPKGNAPRMATITIKVVPHASRDQICGFLDKALKIQVMAPPEGGRANQAVIEVLSEALGIKRHQIQLLKGHFQAQKVLQIAGLTQTELDQKLANFQ